MGQVFGATLKAKAKAAASAICRRGCARVCVCVLVCMLVCMLMCVIKMLVVLLLCVLVMAITSEMMKHNSSRRNPCVCVSVCVFGFLCHPPSLPPSVPLFLPAVCAFVRSANFNEYVWKSLVATAPCPAHFCSSAFSSSYSAQAIHAAHEYCPFLGTIAKSMQSVVAAVAACYFNTCWC